ncbi:MAG TPA: hypothetical protein PLQ81_14140, partial [bacterium]|nr:hypothetical protein [bacterium]
SKSESAKPLIGNIAGKPDFLNLKSNEAYKSRALEFSKNKYGIGIGAFGESFEECKSRFGEYAALNGTAAYLPSGSGNAPDFIISSGNLIPKINILYGFTMTGDFDSYFRFESKDDKNGVKFSELIKTAVELSETGTAGIILVAETTGMVGVSLRKSPLLPEPESNSIFDYPQIRTNLNFTIEPAFKRCLTVTIGIADKNNNAVLNPFVRKISNNSDIYAHFHSLIFTYQPLRKNDIELDSTIASLFEKQSLLSILHLINDERNITGIGQSEFSRGVCWFAPVSLK